MHRSSGLLCALLFLLIIMDTESNAQSQPAPVPPDWQTHAERTDYRETPLYEETLAYCRKLVAASSSQIRLSDFGRSGEGRALPLVIAATNGTFTPEATRRAGKVVVSYRPTFMQVRPMVKTRGLRSCATSLC
jgi:hypothetical protein